MPPPVSAQLIGHIKSLDVSSLIGQHVKSVAASVAFDATGHIARIQEQLAEPLRELAELFDGYEDDERLLLERLVPRGWLISPSMAIRTVRLLAREFENRTDDEVDNALVEYFDPKQCARIIDSLYSDPMFDRMRPLLHEAIVAHDAGLYRLAIAGWLIAIDGIAKERYGTDRVFAEVKSKNGARMRATLARTTGNNDPTQDALVEIVRQVSMATPSEYLPKRDLVLHGRAINYGNERASVQLMLVLEVMHHCAPIRQTPALSALSPDGISQALTRPDLGLRD